MICPNCQTSNRAESKFCKSCGTPLSQITSPELPPMMPEEQSFQAQQRPVDAYKTEEHFQVGTSIAYQADIPSAGVPQSLPLSDSSEWTAMPPPQAYYSASQAYPPQTSPYYQQQPNAYPPQTPPIKPPIELAKKKPFIFLSVLLVLLIIALVLVLTVFRPMITRRIMKADGTDSTPLASGLIMSDSEEPDPEWGSLPSDEPNLMEEPIPVEEPEPTEIPRPIYIASGQAITLENAGQLQEIAQLGAGHVISISYSPDGNYVAIATYTGFDIYNVQSGEFYKEKLKFNEKINDVVFLHDGSLLIGTDFGIDHYSADDFNYVRTYSTDRIAYAFSLSADGKTLLSLNYFGFMVYKIDGDTLKESHEIILDEYARTFDISSDGTKVATANYDNELKIWEVESGRLLHEIDVDSESVFQISWSPNSNVFATAGIYKTVILWNADGTQNEVLDTSEDFVDAVKFSPDGKRLITGCGNYEVQIWDVASASLEKTLKGSENVFYKFDFDASGKKLIALNAFSTVLHWDIDSDSIGEQISVYTENFRSAAISPSGDRIFYLDSNGFSSMSNSKGDVLWSALYKYPDQMLAPVFSADGSMLIAGTYAGEVNVLDVESGEVLSHFKAHNNYIRKLAISPDGKTIATASDDKTVKLWSFDTHELLATLSGHKSVLREVAFSPDGAYLASASDNDPIIIWDLQTGTQLYKLDGHESYVSAIAFSPDGNLLASVASDNNVIIWDPKTGSQLKKIERSYNWATDIAFSTDSKSIFVPGSYSIEQYSIENGNLFADIGDVTDNVDSVFISADGRTMISCGTDGVVRVFRVP